MEKAEATVASSESPRPRTTPESKREPTVRVAPETLTAARMAAAESKSESPAPVAPEIPTKAVTAAAVGLVKERERKDQVPPPASPLIEEPVRKKRKHGEAAVLIPRPPTPAAARSLQMESKVTAVRKKQRLRKVEREARINNMELRQAVIASRSQAKGIRCESANSGLQSIVAENQTLANIQQKRIEASVSHSAHFPFGLRAPAMAPTSGAALSSSSPSTAGSEPNIITLSSDDAPRHTSGTADVITLSSSDNEQEASSWKGSSSAGSKAGPVVLTSSDSDSDGQLLAECQERRLPRNVAWMFSDEVRILTALVKKRLESGQLPRSQSAILDAISGGAHLKRQNPTAGDVAKKVENLKGRFKKVIASGGPRDFLRDRELYRLSTNVWPELLR